jgi:hypothetical protein
MDRKDYQKVSKIVNEHIADFTRNDASIITNEFCFSSTNNNELIYLRLNPAVDDTDSDIITEAEEGVNVFDKIFNLIAPKAKIENISYFHYKKFKYAFDFINKAYIMLPALSNFVDPQSEDVKEYKHFFDEVVNIGTTQSFIDKQKDNFFIFCLTEDNKTEEFWNKYADKHKGLCLEMEIEHKQLDYCLYNFNKIRYSNGNEFQFFSNMQNELHKNFGKYLCLQGLARFGALYKRPCWAWERETRLLIHKDNVIFEITKTDNKKYMTIPFENDLFSIKIKSVTLGKNLNYCQKRKIKKILKQKGIEIIEIID